MKRKKKTLWEKKKLASCPVMDEVARKEIFDEINQKIKGKTEEN